MIMRRTPSSSRLPVLLAILVGLVALLGWHEPRFIEINNLINILRQSSMVGLIALGMTLVILTGGIDMSVGSMISLLSLLTSGLIDGKANLVVPVAAGILVLGALIGAINGLGIVWLKVHPLIVTLGMGALLQGIALLYSLGPAGKVPPNFKFLAYGKVLGLPIAAVFAILLFIAVALFLRYVRLGRYIYAVGDVIEVEDFILKDRTMIPLAGPANKQGRIAAAFLAEERAALGSWVYSQEYECSFAATSAQLFSEDALRAMYDAAVRPLFPTT